MKKSFMDRRGAAVAALAGLIAITAAGCGGSGGSGSNGSLSVALSDSPPNLPGVTAVNVTVTKVDVHPSNGTDPTTDTAWKTVWQGSKTFNLLSLANLADVTQLPLIVNRDTLSVGHYDSLRMILDPNSATITVNGATQPLVVPSGSETGLKSKQFDIANTQDTVLLLDFNVSQSVTLLGNGTYQLKPVIELAPLTLTASLTGKVVNTSGAPMSALVTVTDGSGNVWNSITTVGATPSATDGVFAVHGLPSGTYTLQISATGMTTVSQSVNLLAPNTTNTGNVTLQ